MFRSPNRSVEFHIQRSKPWSCRVVFAVVYFAIALATAGAIASDRDFELVRGLRERNYFDYAYRYLDKLAERPSMPEEQRRSIPYERAITLREQARFVRDPEKQSELLVDAVRFLERFARESPSHPRAGDANSELAQILLQRAEVELYQAKSPATKSARSDFQRRGRELVQKARAILKVTFDQHETAFKAFPTYIDGQKEPKLEAERDQVERSLILESLGLAKCAYLEAQSCEPSSREFKTAMTRAVEDYESVYQKYRRKIGGLHARAWQGKCYDELGDRQKALGIYNEILDQPDTEAGMLSLKSQTLLFKLNCLFAREDYQASVDLAEEWLKKNSAESKTQVGLGIQWEQARAAEALGNDRTQTKPEQEKHWRQARTLAQQINRFPGEYKDVSFAMMQRLQTKLGGKERKPDDFDSANSQGRQAFERAQDIRKELDGAAGSGLSTEDRTRLEREWTNALNDAARNFEIALSMVGRKESSADVLNARIMSAYTNFYLRRNYEAAVIARFVTRTATGSADDSIALDAAFIAMAAFVQEYNDDKSDPDQKQDALNLILKAANSITERWPDSEKTNEARMVLGQVYKSSKKYLEAATWFQRVPQTDPKYPDAQMAAGQAYWAAYGAAARLTKETRPNAETFADWKTQSEKHLRTGIDLLSKAIPAEDEVPVELAIAKISLAENLLSQEKEAEAVSLLQNDPQSIVKAVTVDDEAKRPAGGVQRRAIAKLTYILLLRAYIGMGVDRLNDARAAMKTLETIVAADASTDLTELYVELGRSLKSELERLRNNGEVERVKHLTAAFESFLDDLFKKRESQTFGALSWMGETYFALAEISPDSPKSTVYYDRAADAFKLILERVKSDPNFASMDQVLNVKVRMVRLYRLKKDYSNADRLLADVIKQRPNDLRTQVEGASVYQDWGSSDDRKKFVIAITGSNELGLWGWAGIAKRIQLQKEFVEKPELVDAFLDARYGVSLCRFRYALGSAAKDKQKELDSCAAELVGSSTIMKSIPDEKRDKLNELYREVLRESGKPVSDLPRLKDATKEASKQKSAPAATAETSKPKPSNPKPKHANSGPSKSSGNPLPNAIVIAVGCAILGICIAGWILVKGRRPNRRSHLVEFDGVESAFAGIAIEDSGTNSPHAPAKPPRIRTAETTKSVVAATPPPTTQSPATRGSAKRFIIGKAAINPIPKSNDPPSQE